MNGRSLTIEAATQLSDGINLVLSRWAALRMAIENEWGGRDSVQKSQELGSSLFRRLTLSREPVYMDDLEDILEDFMLSLNTEIGDGSIEEVSLKLMEMHEECSEGNFESIRRLSETNAPSLSYIGQPKSDDEEDSEDEDENPSTENNNTSEMEVDPPQRQPVPNPKEAFVSEAPEVVDGWTVVSSRRSKGRKN